MMWQRAIGNRNGMVLVLIAVAMLAILGLAALAIDAGYLYVVKGQLQNSADACALAGAGALYPGSTAPLLNSLPPPDWDAARSTAAAFVGHTRAAGEPLREARVEYGYWNLNSRGWKQGSPVSQGVPPGPPMGSCSLTGGPCSTASNCPNYPAEGCKLMEVPAVLASVGRSEGENGGPVATFFAGAVGYPTASPRARALAARGAPSALAGVFPFAISACIVNEYFSQNPLPAPPLVFTDTSPYHTRNGNVVLPGQWTNLLPVKSPSATVLVEYLEHMRDSSLGRPSPAVSAGSDSATYIHIDPGTKAAVYHEAQKLVDAGKGLVVMPVVEPASDCSVTPGASMKVVAFAAFQLTGTTSLSFTGYLVGLHQTPPGSITGGSTGSNAVAPAVLVR